MPWIAWIALTAKWKEIGKKHLQKEAKKKRDENNAVSIELQ